MIRFAKSAREEVYAGRRLLVIAIGLRQQFRIPMPCPHGGSMADVADARRRAFFGHLTDMKAERRKRSSELLANLLLHR